MARDRRRAVRPQTETYNNDGIVITKTPAEETPAPTEIPIQRRNHGNSVDFDVTDVIDTLASFNTGWFEKEKAEKPGECYICHKQTPYRFRKVCADCMKKYSGEIYDLASEAVENGQTSITLNTEV